MGFESEALREGRKTGRDEMIVKAWRAVRAGIAALAIVATPGAALEVSGTIEDRTVWLEADSPVRVAGDLLLPAGARLDIGPGVEVVFAGPFVFEVQGNLQAVGERGRLVVFRSEEPAVDSLRWRGIRFVNADRASRLHFCRFQDGWARGAWPYNCGGGVYLEGSSPTITRCEFTGNRADGDGGALYGWFTTASIKNTVFWGNRSGRFGGALFVDYSRVSIINVTAAFNQARTWGGGFFLGAASAPTLTNCILVFNTQQDSLGGGRIVSGDEFFADLARGNGSQEDVSFSCISVVLPGRDLFPGTGNLGLDPLFVSASPPYDFHLQTSSPCVDAGDPRMPAGAEPDVLVNRVDMGAYGGTEEATLSVPVIYVERLPLNYDSIRTGSSLPKEIRVENRGHYPLQIYSFQFNTDAFFPDSAKNDEGNLVPSYLLSPIEPGGRAKYVVHFRPTRLVTYLDTLTIVSSDTLQPAPRIPLVGKGINPVAVMEDTLNFNLVWWERRGTDSVRVERGRQIDAEHFDSLRVVNRGESELVLSSVTVQGDAFGATIVDRSLAPGQSGWVRFSFLPTRPESYSGFASIRTNDRTLGVALLGKGIGAKMAVTVDTLFMGYAWAGGDTIRAELTVYNRGDTALVINGVTSSDPAFSAELPPEGIAVNDSDSVGLVVSFHPRRAGQDYSATLQIIAANYPTPAAIIVQGRGMASAGRYVFGTVTGVWDWAPGATDYVILDSVYIPPDGRLRIMPGARVVFEPGAFLRADGELRAMGLPGDSIYFIARDTSGTEAARWGGLHLALDDATRLEYCVVRGARVGMTVRESSPLVQFCTISDNRDTARVGGGVYLENSGARLQACVIEGNAARFGGGVGIVNSVPRIVNSIIRNNLAADGGGVGMRFLVSGRVQSNLVYGNRGGGVAMEDHCNPTIVNNTIVDNNGWGLTARVRSLPALVNTIVWGNTGGAVQVQTGSDALVSYCDVEGGWRGATNLDTLPGFAVGTGLPYELDPTSPLVDAGNPEASHQDFFFPPSQGSPRNDVGAYGGPLGGGWEALTADLSLFQSPAFPQNLEVMVYALDSLQTAPVCSVRLGDGPLEAVALERLSDYAYLGRYTAQQSGTLFVTLNAETAAGARKMGRTYVFTLVKPERGGGGGVYSVIPGVDGWLHLPPGAQSQPVAVLAGTTGNKPQPETSRLFISDEFVITGLEGLSAPAEVFVWLPEISAAEGWSPILVRRTRQGWEPVPSRRKGGKVSAELTGSGTYAVAMEAGGAARPEVPMSVEFLRAHPNPFNSRVVLEFEVATSGEATLRLFDLSGREVGVAAAGWHHAGRHQAIWDGMSAEGRALPSGLYWARLKTPSGDHTTKLLLLR